MVVCLNFADVFLDQNLMAGTCAAQMLNYKTMPGEENTDSTGSWVAQNKASAV